MRLPIVTCENLFYCECFLEGLKRRLPDMLSSTFSYPSEKFLPLEVSMSYPTGKSVYDLKYRRVLRSPDEVNALVFGLALLVKAVQELADRDSKAVKALTAYTAREGATGDFSVNAAYSRVWESKAWPSQWTTPRA